MELSLFSSIMSVLMMLGMSMNWDEILMNLLILILQLIKNLIKKSLWKKEESLLDGSGTLKKINIFIFCLMVPFGFVYSLYSVASFWQSIFLKINSRKLYWVECLKDMLDLQFRLWVFYHFIYCKVNLIYNFLIR